VGAQRGESTPERSKSLQNLEEVKVVCSVAVALRAAHPNATIAVLTFYKGQLLEIMRALAAALKVEVLTVDACQGSEFEYVVLSTVRSNSRGTLGFVKDRQRICVAISRAMRQLVIVGCADTLAVDGCWRTVNSRAESQTQRHWTTLGRAAANVSPSGAGRSVLEELAKGKADAREALLCQTAVSLMRQQPSFNDPQRRDKPRDVMRASTGDGRSVQPSRTTQQHPEKQRSLDSSASRRSTNWTQPHDYDAAFPVLGASRAPVRALHLANTNQQQAVRDVLAVASDDQPTGASHMMFLIISIV
jgi:hypothetical protein